MFEFECECEGDNVTRRAARYSDASARRATIAGVATKLRALFNLRKLEEISDDSVCSALSDNAVRRLLPAEAIVFSEGNEASNIFLIESGQISVRRQQCRSARPTVRVLSDSDVFSYDCGGTRAVHSAELEMILESFDQASRSSVALLSARPQAAALDWSTTSPARSAAVLRSQFRS